MATYRLFEFSSFLELTGQLPSGCIANEECMVNKDDSILKTLENTQFNAMINYYQEIYPQYGAFCKLYEEEKEPAKSKHTLRNFPEMSNWLPKNTLLSDADKVLIKGPLYNIKKLKRIHVRDKYQRKIVFSDSTSESYSNVYSSYVYH